MNFIWAFEFVKSKGPVTKQDRDYDLYDFMKVSHLPI